MNKVNYGLKVGDVCRLKSQPDYCYATIRKIHEPYDGINMAGYKIAKCYWTERKIDLLGFYKYFALRDLVKEEEE